MSEWNNKQIMVPRLVVAEGDTELADFIRRVARKEGWDVTLCRDGADLLLVLAETSEPVLALIGMEIPALDGAEVVRHLYDHKEASGRLRLCLLGESSDIRILAARMIADAGDLEVAALLYKPFNQHEFEAILARECSVASGLRGYTGNLRKVHSALRRMLADQCAIYEEATASLRILWERSG